MSLDRTDFDDLLAVVRDFIDRHVDETLVDFSGPAAETPLPTLASDLSDVSEESALPWVFEVVETVAENSASWGYALASRYTAQLMDPTAAVSGGYMARGTSEDGRVHIPAAPTQAGELTRLWVVLPDGSSRVVTDVYLAQHQPRRTGLAAAGLATVEGVAESAQGDDATGARILAILLGAAAVGVSRAMLKDAVEYTTLRKQFGQPISRFSGLRALLGEREAELGRARATLRRAALDLETAPEASSLAADHVLGTAIDCVQALGGYGYIDEYPISGRFRDAVSLRARITTAQDSWRSAARKIYAGHVAE